MTVAGDIGVIGDANVDGSMNVVGNVLLTSGSSAEQQVHIIDDGINRHNLGALVVAGGAGVSGNVNMGNNLSVVGDIDTTGDLILMNASEIRWNSKQQFYIQDYFAADNRFGFCNSGNGQVRIFMSNTHTPSNILFSRAFSDTSYNDLMKISYTGDTTIYSTSESATSTAGALVYGGVGISGR
jgi:hypothetical protein